MSRRKLPVLLERDLQAIHAERLAQDSMFSAAVRKVAEEGRRSISCSTGCSACCSHPVMISLLEGIMLYRWIAERGRWTTELRKRLQEHADATSHLAYEVWFLSNLPCPFLDDHQCSVHEARPLVCRTTWSISDPYDCHPHRFGARTGIVPRAHVLERFNYLEGQKLRDHDLGRFWLPISKAVLLAEEILSGKIELGDVQARIAQEYL